MRLIHIAPELPPILGGIADYADILSQQLAEIAPDNLELSLVCPGAENARRSFEHAWLDMAIKAEDLAGDARSAARTRRQGTPTALLLQYSGYGYSSYGAPWRLVDGVRRLRERHGCPVVTVFHELYATSRRPWERAFWTAPAQYAVAAAVARSSDVVIANRSHARGFLSRWSGEDSVRVCPTFSNVGEPELVPSIAERAPCAVLFGKSVRKAATYERYGAGILSLLEEMKLERVLDIGPPVEGEVRDTLSFSVDSVGVLSKQEVSGLLKRASIGILKHPLHCLTKSGVWAAFAAHGVPTFIIGEGRPGRDDGLKEGQHFIGWNGVEPPGQVDLQSVSEAVKAWYDENAHSRLAARAVLGSLLELGFLSRAEDHRSSETQLTTA